MMNRKPKSFRLVYGSGVGGEFCDPVTGKPWYRLSWRAMKRSMTELAKTANDDLTLINNCTGDFITVTPEGDWR